MTEWIYTEPKSPAQPGTRTFAVGVQSNGLGRFPKELTIIWQPSEETTRVVIDGDGNHEMEEVEIPAGQTGATIIDDSGESEDGGFQVDP